MTTVGNGDAPQIQKAGFLRRNRIALMIGGPLLIVAGVVLVWYLGSHYQSTDDAYVQAQRLPISSSVGGRVVELAVSENQHVKAGQLLFKIRADDYNASVMAARARLADARLRAQSLRATYEQQQVTLRSLQTTVDFTAREATRQQQLLAAGVSSRQDYEGAVQASDQAKAQMAVARQQAAVALANLGGKVDSPESFPAVMQAQADLERAGISLGDTVIVAPKDGVVTRVEQLQLGSYVSPATPVFWLVAGVPWVEANFKENQLGKMRIGQKVEIDVDAYSDQKFEGHVASFSPGTGSAFSPLPAQNATGNWVKVVQRLPVRIAFDSMPPEMAGRAGLSAHVKVDTATSEKR
jgi:membrane fusion protein (multidrug efflux system)